MLPKVKKILFPTDLSESARSAYNYAAAIAYGQDADMVILHVLEDQTPYASVHVQSFLGEDRWNQLQDTYENAARQMLSGKQREGIMIKEALGEFCRTASQDLGQSAPKADEVLVAKGNVVDEILTAAAETDSDLIVMAHHIRGALGEAVLGSTTRRVIRRCRIPVMLIPVDTGSD